MLNKTLLIGRLTRDPEIRFLPSGTQVTSFSIAVNRAYKSGDNWKEETYFFDIETFGYLAERLGKQLFKGYQVLIEGQLRQDRWESKSGEKRSRVKIVGDKVNILSKPIGEHIESKTSENAPEELEAPSIEELEEDVPF